MKADIGQLNFIDFKLRELLQWLEEKTGLEFTITSIYRENDDGVHGQIPVRGVDLRCRSIDLGLAVEALINRFWSYDPSRENLKCCLLHGDGPNLHFHLQVHPNTEYRG